MSKLNQLETFVTVATRGDLTAAANAEASVAARGVNANGHLCLAEIASGALVPVLEDFAAPPNGIYAVFPQRKHLPLRVRLWVDFLKEHFARPGLWLTHG